MFLVTRNWSLCFQEVQLLSYKYPEIWFYTALQLSLSATQTLIYFCCEAAELLSVCGNIKCAYFLPLTSSTPKHRRHFLITGCFMTCGTAYTESQ